MNLLVKAKNWHWSFIFKVGKVTFLWAAFVLLLPMINDRFLKLLANSLSE